MIDQIKELTDAIFYVMSSNMGMGDSLIDEADYLAGAAGISYDLDEDDAKDTILNAISELIRIKSSTLTEYLKYFFTEPDLIDEIFEDVVTSSMPAHRSLMFIAVHTIYEGIGGIPGGNVIKHAIQQNIYDPLGDFPVDAAKVGWAIGHIYWRYVTAPEYGPRSNGMMSVGHTVQGSKYSYEFTKEISSYHYSDRSHARLLPRGVGYTCKFRESESSVIADIYAIAVYSNTSEVIANTPDYSVTISDFEDKDIEAASHEIADWLNGHVEDAIEFGLSL